MGSALVQRRPTGAPPEPLRHPSIIRIKAPPPPPPPPPRPPRLLLRLPTMAEQLLSLGPRLERLPTMAEQLLSLGPRLERLPEIYIRPERQRPRLDEVIGGGDIPLVDLAGPDRAATVRDVGDACRSYGAFQVVNHGIPAELVRRMMEVAGEFFRLPAEEKMSHYSDDPAKKMRLSTSFNVTKETVRNWRDYLRLHCHPLEDYVPDWPSNPPLFKDTVSSYCKEVRQLGFRLQGLISESLGLQEDYIVTAMGEQEQHMAINYYPPCPSPELTYGLPAHTDPNGLTVLLLDPQVAGLHVLKDGRWIMVDPLPDALVVNIGDQIQAMSNAEYKSVWHRAVVDRDRERMSVASFLAPSNTAVIRAPAALVGGDGRSAVYRSFTYAEYYQKFWSRNLDQEHCLDLFRCSSLET